MARTLIAMRHAKSSWAEHLPDHDRPLAARGRRDGVAAGNWLASRGLHPDLVLCSGAVRTRQTWERVYAGGVRAGTVEYTDALYDADPAEVLTLLRRVPDTVQTLLVIGHNPTTEQLVARLARGTGNPDWWASMARKFPTSAIAVLEVPGSWAELAPGRANLSCYEVPRG
ncbi:SixA phosphatase family protein [Granulicoccus phenolivorans]|uniref:SixA phosphatase family protein n=1 Tax=Granulicoccus phenolivorans TaxID=266854 RepID=UPI00040670A9|nr:histidine phosphatase family protein [Granulicoccus phenolivorans]